MDKHEATTRIAMFGGSGAAITVWGLQVSELAAIIGAVVAVLGLLMNMWVINRRDKREAEEHEARMAQLTQPPE